MDDFFAGSSAGKIGNAIGPQLNDGFYPELRVGRISFFKSHDEEPCFKVEVTVLVAANGHEVDDVGEAFEKLNGHAHKSYNVEARGRVRRFLGALAGFSKPSDIDANVGVKDLEIAASDAQPFDGSIVSAFVTSKKGTNKKTGAEIRYVTVVFGPCLDADGKPKTAGAIAPSVTQVKAVAPPPPPAAAPAVKEDRWPHPQMPGHEYNAKGEVFEIESGRKVA